MSRCSSESSRRSRWPGRRRASPGSGRPRSDRPGSRVPPRCAGRVRHRPKQGSAASSRPGTTAQPAAALEAECERLVGLGATRSRRDEPAPPAGAGYFVMADPEGSESCLD
ncbi:VOC family protein [Streptomyces sp. NPDC058694]|uniref:VOC family protein n=1 Tax=Streptomyces sp. NPDC058694 TaxID=3346603 RepID=UPI003650B144